MFHAITTCQWDEAGWSMTPKKGSCYSAPTGGVINRNPFRRLLHSVKLQLASLSSNAATKFEAKPTHFRMHVNSLARSYSAPNPFQNAHAKVRPDGASKPINASIQNARRLRQRGCPANNQMAGLCRD